MSISIHHAPLRDGCYLIRYHPAERLDDVLFFEGTLRILRVDRKGRANPSGSLRAGGDLYARRRPPGPTAKDAALNDPRDLARKATKSGAKKGVTIPIFPRNLYRYYLRILKIMDGVPAPENVSLQFAVYEFSSDKEWPNPGTRWVCLDKVELTEPRSSEKVARRLEIAPVSEDEDSGENKARLIQPLYLQGNVLNEETGEIAGMLELSWISPKLRQATIKVHSVSSEKKDEFPLPGGKASFNDNWSKTFEAAGWEIKTTPGADLGRAAELKPLSAEESKSQSKGSEPIYKPWTIGDLQRALYILRLRETLQNSDTKGGLSSDTEQILHRLKDPLNEVTLEDIRAAAAELARVPDPSDPLDKAWTYHLLCVPTIDGFDRGVMFDTYGSDSSTLPGEAAAVGTKWKFGSDAERLRNEARIKAEAQPAIEAQAATDAEAERLEARWGRANRQPLDSISTAYFRVAVHEIGHAMGLTHNFLDDGFMNTTDSIADEGLTSVTSLKNALVAAKSADDRINGSAPNLAVILNRASHPKAVSSQTAPTAPDTNPSAPSEFEAKLRRVNTEERAIALDQVKQFEKHDLFPENVLLQFHPDDLEQLRFGPDIVVRPGTTFESSGPLRPDESGTRADGLQLEVTPLLAAVPFGAPVRINLRLKNDSEQDQEVPSGLSLKTGVVDGKVLDPDGDERSFWPLKRWEDSDPGGRLGARETRTYSITLLRGPQKALFPKVGDHVVKARVTWEREGETVWVEGQGTVRITPPVDDSHRAAALKVLSTPEILLSLAIIGDQFFEGNEAIQTALAHPILRPHFAVIDAKRWLIGNPDASPDKQKDRAHMACQLIDQSTILSFDEIERLCKLLQDASADSLPRFETVARILMKRVAFFLADGSIEEFRVGALWSLKAFEPYLHLLERNSS